MLCKTKLHYGIGLCLLVFLYHPVAGQTDSTAIYKKIKKAADKYKLTTWIYHAIFVDPKPIEYPIQPATKEEKIVNPYLKYQGSKIKDVVITVYDPFGHSINSEVPAKINSFQKFGNKAHITTRHWVIINKLLFKKNDTINALAISESERLLRQAVYVNDARIFLTPNKNKDSVTVNVVVQDKWAITVPTVITDVSANAKFRNQNLFGLGQQFEQFVGFKRPDLMEYNGAYDIANIDNTYISGRLAYQSNNNGTSVGLGFDRPFYSPLSTWAGGVSLSSSQRFHNYTDTIDRSSKVMNLTCYGYDAWLGKSIKLNTKKSFFNQSSNIIVGSRYYNTTYYDRPDIAFNTVASNCNLSAYIGNLGFAVQQYYKDKYIYRFGANEDVPEGFIMQVLYGAEKKELKPIRYYTALEFARAKHFNFGYLTATFQHSIFFNRYISNNITNSFRLYYFSDLLRIKKWYFREFVDCKLAYGENKEPDERVTLTSEELYGFNNGGITGTRKMLTNFETVAYAPYNVIGFRFAPFFLLGLGMLGDDTNPLAKSHVYQAYSLGLMVRNENLLSSTFQISVGLYPFLPNRRNPSAIYNPVTSFTLRVRAFTISKPAFISY